MPKGGPNRRCAEQCQGETRGEARHRAALEALEGASDFARQQEYLETVIEISRRGAVSRMMYLAESPGI